MGEKKSASLLFQDAKPLPLVRRMKNKLEVSLFDFLVFVFVFKSVCVSYPSVHQRSVLTPSSPP